MNEVSLRELASVDGGFWNEFINGFIAGFYAQCGF
jgi:hypothetical protein